MTGRRHKLRGPDSARAAIAAEALVALLLAMPGAAAATSCEDQLNRAVQAGDDNALVALASRLIEDGKASGDRGCVCGAYIERAEARGRAGRHKEALEDADAAVAACPDESGLVTRADLRWHDCTGSLGDLDKALAIAPAIGRSPVFFVRASLYPACRTRDQAESDYLSAIKSEKEGSGPIGQDSRLMLGMLLCGSRRYREGLRWLTSAIERSPQSAEFWLYRGNCRAAAGMGKPALSDFDKGFALLAKSSRTKVSDTSRTFIVRSFDPTVAIVEASRRGAEIKAAAGDRDGALDSLGRGAPSISGRPAAYDEADRREIARFYALRARLWAEKGETAFAREDGAAACQWHATQCRERGRDGVARP